MRAAEKRELVGELAPDALVADGYDSAIIGTACVRGTDVVVYSRRKIIKILMKSMSEEEAEEFFEFNIGHAYVGEATPVFVDLL